MAAIAPARRTLAGDARRDGAYRPGRPAQPSARPGERGLARAPPARFVVAAGITTAAPAIARLLRIVAGMPQGMVVLPGLDLGMAAEEWDALGPHEAGSGKARRREGRGTPDGDASAISPETAARPDEGRRAARLWSGQPGVGLDAPRCARVRAIAAALRPPPIPRAGRRPEVAPSLSGVSAAVFADDGQEAQAIALAMREALETPARTAALVTPDRALASRVAAALARWGISVDDSAGQPLWQTPPGALLLALADFAADFDPVRLLGLLKHPLVRAGEGRLGVARRGTSARPRAARAGAVPGWAGVTARIAECAGDSKARGHGAALAIGDWWAEARRWAGPGAGTLCRRGLRAAVGLARRAGRLGWAGCPTRGCGRALPDAPRPSCSPSWALAKRRSVRRWSHPAICRRCCADLLSGESVRPPYGGHPRLFIWGLLEARLQRADLMILGGLERGRWPAAPRPDPWLAPGMRADARPAGAGAPHRRWRRMISRARSRRREVVVTRARRSGGARRSPRVSGCGCRRWRANCRRRRWTGRRCLCLPRRSMCQRGRLCPQRSRVPARLRTHGRATSA